MPQPESTEPIAAARSSEHRTPPSTSILEKLIDLAPDSMIVADGEGKIVDLNARTEQMFGYQRGELLGSPIEILVPSRFRDSHPQKRRSYSAQPKSRAMGVGLDLYAARKDGSEFPVDIMLAPIHTAEGTLVLSVIRDITEQRAATEALHRTEHQLRMLVENVRDHAIFLLDPDGRIQTWNSGAERIKGYKAEEVIGRHFSLFYPPDALERNRPQEALRIAATEGRFQEEAWRLRKDGSRFWANVVITALRDARENVIGFAKVTRDFSDRKQAENALLLQLSTALMPNLDFDRLLLAISASIQQGVPHDGAQLAIFDPDEQLLRAQFLESEGKQAKETVLPLNASAAGFVFTARQPLLLNRLEDARFAEDTFRHLRTRGLRSACWLPLLHDDRPIGTVMVGSRRESAFTQHDLEILTHLAGQIAAAVHNALAIRNMEQRSQKLSLEKQYLEDELSTQTRFDEIVGESAGLRKVLKQVETVAPTDASVLILGETGTGKELVARAIHRLSSRNSRTFVKLNCAAIPSGLLESELFGHEKGAFTGAIMQKVGRLELAHHGTLFLDEVGDIPLELQPKLLRALQEKEFERLGSTRTIKVDVRLIAATNRNLGKMVTDKEFRSDLYYRLKVFPVEVPALRDRPEDIPLLVRYFVDRHARNLGKKIQTIPPEVMNALVRWHWPGNIRELENFLERAVILSTASALRAPLGELAAPDNDAPVSTDLAGAEREHILRVLREAGGIIAGPNGAAARLGLKRTTLNAKMKKLGIQRSDYSASS